MKRTPTVVALAGIAVTALATGAAAAGTPPPSSTPIDLGAFDPTNVRLDARALLSADLVVDDIPTGALSDPANGRTPPYPGQVVPGFSGVVANDDGTYWAMPDNGFGTIENSTDFLLRLYHVTPDWETAAGGSGEIVVDDFISLRDPNNVIGFPIVNEDTPERLLTGGDLDIESVQRTPDGTFWIGDEFGPFIVHFDADGVLLGRADRSAVRDVAAEPASRRRRAGRRAQPWHRGDGVVARRHQAVPDQRGRPHRRRGSGCGATSTRSTWRPAPTPIGRGKCTPRRRPT